MKKTDLVLIGLVIVIIAIGIFSNRGNTATEDDITYPVTLAGEIGLHEISYSDYAQMVEKGETFVVVIERTGCYYCQMYMPILEEYVNENKIAVTYINTDNLTEEESELLSTTNKYLKNNQWGTPTTLFMQGSKVIDAIAGYVEKEEIDKFFSGRVVKGE